MRTSSGRLRATPMRAIASIRRRTASCPTIAPCSPSSGSSARCSCSPASTAPTTRCCSRPCARRGRPFAAWRSWSGRSASRRSTPCMRPACAACASTWWTCRKARGTCRSRACAAWRERIAPRGWHLELLAHVDQYPALDRDLADFPVDLVFGHLGYMRTDRGSQTPGFRALLRLLEDGPRLGEAHRPLPDLHGRHAARGRRRPTRGSCCASAPERVVWGSDWPHVMVKGAMPNDGDLADLLARLDTRRGAAPAGPRRQPGAPVRLPARAIAAGCPPASRSCGRSRSARARSARTRRASSARA